MPAALSFSCTYENLTKALTHDAKSEAFCATSTACMLHGLGLSIDLVTLLLQQLKVLERKLVDLLIF
ncbi:hypothetical protein [Pseudomonas boanensis]|uniref:hypothetical protein n=1 Tax=Metapseudomonas boanensis TaxID=2822138 RepID=UPI0035D51360